MYLVQFTHISGSISSMGKKCLLLEYFSVGRKGEGVDEDSNQWAQNSVRMKAKVVITVGVTHVYG